ncbi:MAG: dipeptide/oligopeptide/nickel ABC transporter permease/ATP-binding protein [Salinisphaera sp.]|nr:dipeptide/oligopeptide/nickel ABC transporter permease/ATP-binding protein [Salinisphaera sp.]
MNGTLAALSRRLRPQARNDNRPSAWRRLRHNHMATAGLVIIVTLCAVALAAPLLPLADPNAIDLANRLLPPFSAGHWLGTDQLGRDMLSRLIWGARVSIAIGVAATAFSTVVGSLLGLVAGFYGRWLDNVIMRSIDTVMAFPYLLLALAIVAALGPGLMNALFAIAIINVPFFARAVRGTTVGIASREYVDAARLTGQSTPRVLFGEVLPNVAPIIVITISTTVGWMILETAGLSFLGLGAQPPQADLGSMLADGRKVMLTAPHVATITGLVILVLVIGINLLGDGLRDVLAPRLKSGAMVRPAAATAVGPQAGRRDDDTAVGRDPAPVLSVRGLTTHFELGNRAFQAVRDVNFDLYPGECLGIVGESGSGKSVTAMSLMGLVPTPPGRIIFGSVRYRDEELVGAPLPRLQALRGDRVAYIFQDPLTTLNPLMRVGDQIAEAVIRHHGGSRRAARECAVALMRQVQLPDAEARLSSYPHELSGGMRQRVGIAMALVNDPDVIIADEPTTALDVTIQAEILALFSRLRREHEVALIFITHDFGVVSELCDRLIVMYAGQVVESGNAADVLEAPAHPYTRRLMDCVPKLGQAERELVAIDGLPPDVSRLPVGCTFADRCDWAIDACRRGGIGEHTVTQGHWARCIRISEVLGQA